jgi:putative Mn2+ efflux pump MntP
MSTESLSLFFRNNPLLTRIIIIAIFSIIAMVIGFNVGKPIGRFIFNILH